MPKSATTISKGSWILVTGANGFVASHITREFLQRGYKVRGTVRDLEKSSWLVQDVFKSYTDDGNFELVSVPDLAAKNAFDNAVKGVSAIAHVASVTSLASDPNIVIPQTVAGVTSILHASLKEPSVKAFVYTSSCNAATMFVPGNSTHVKRDTWNEEVVKLAWAPPPYDPMHGMVVYSASKTEAEMAMWKFAAETKPHFRINSISPVCILGEPLNKKHLETPYAYLKLIYDGNMTFLAGMPSCKSLNNQTIEMSSYISIIYFFPADSDLQLSMLTSRMSLCFTLQRCWIQRSTMHAFRRGRIIANGMMYLPLCRSSTHSEHLPTASLLQQRSP
jgi:nucleoside-diphosphate-sugar epimerase